LKKSSLLLWLISGLIFWGCAAATGPAAWRSSPATQAVVRSGYRVEFTAVKEGKPFYSAFAITIKNTGPEPLTVDWQATRYVHNDKPAGRFMFAGLAPEAIKGALPVDTLAPGQRLAREIWPIKLVAVAPYRENSVKAGSSGFSRGVLPAGKNGIRLILRTAGKTAVETLGVVIISE
jgi:hypothetical protein